MSYFILQMLKKLLAGYINPDFRPFSLSNSRNMISSVGCPAEYQPNDPIPALRIDAFTLF
jgi:hypothetical protein